MAKGKKTFMLYADMIGVFEKLPDEKAGQLIKHIFSYVNDQSPETDDLLLSIAFEPIKTKLKLDLKKWEETCEKNRDNVRKRWEKKNTTEYDRIPNDTKHTDKDKDKDNDKEKDKDNTRGKRFSPPTQIEVESYCRERNNSVNAASFIAFYESKGWYVGKNKMKSWKAAVRTWENNDFNKGNQNGPKSFAEKQRDEYEKAWNAPMPEDLKRKMGDVPQGNGENGSGFPQLEGGNNRGID